jgi:hypothetical protein
VGLAAVGLGVLVLLACWGASFFWRTDNDTKEKFEIIVKNTDGLKDTVKDGQAQIVTAVADVGAKIDALGRKIDGYAHNFDVSVAGLHNDIAKIRQQIAGIDVGKYYPGPYNKTDGTIITREVTVFNNVKHDVGYVVTGWAFKDGAATEPSYQFCYYTLKGGEEGTTFRVDLFTGGKRVDNDAVRKIPNYDEAFGKCQWFSGRAP